MQERIDTILKQFRNDTHQMLGGSYLNNEPTLTEGKALIAIMAVFEEAIPDINKHEKFILPSVRIGYQMAVDDMADQLKQSNKCAVCGVKLNDWQWVHIVDGKKTHFCSKEHLDKQSKEVK